MHNDDRTWCLRVFRSDGSRRTIAVNFRMVIAFGNIASREIARNTERDPNAIRRGTFRNDTIKKTVLPIHEILKWSKTNRDD